MLTYENNQNKEKMEQCKKEMEEKDKEIEKLKEKIRSMNRLKNHKEKEKKNK